MQSAKNGYFSCFSGQKRLKLLKELKKKAIRKRFKRRLSLISLAIHGLARDFSNLERRSRSLLPSGSMCIDKSGESKNAKT